ncbi:MAG: hypothetical protein M0R74_15880 [Dehalococcoidia bacterium]|nr:hypothetical protein [Dehalococcoidia bacterium]
MGQRSRPQDARVTRPNPGRRDNAPIRKRKPSSGIPDVLFAFGAVAWTMAFVFFAASFFDEEVTAGDAGRVLARIFAAALFISGLFIILLGVALLRDDRGRLDHYVFPICLGMVVGALEAYLFLLPAGEWLFAPLLLLVFAVRPVRRLFGRWLRPSPAR